MEKYGIYYYFSRRAVAPPADDSAPFDYARAALASPRPTDAIVFLAHLLPRREAVWWSIQCFRRRRLGARAGGGKPARRATPRPPPAFMSSGRHEERTVMARENETPADVSAAATKAGERVTKEATAQGENVSKASGAFEAASKAATGALEASLKGVQDYQAKLVQCFQANAEANLQLAEKLTQTHSPSEFIETMTSHMRERVALMTEQAKELAALSQEATQSAVDALARLRR